MLVRVARRDDVPTIVALYADDEKGATREAPAALDRYYAAFDALSGEILVGEIDGRVVATLQLTILQQLSFRGSKVAQIEAVRVAHDRRGGGLGGELLRAAIERARAAGCVRVQLTSHDDRRDAHRFYEQLGFVATHTGFKLYF